MNYIALICSFFIWGLSPLFWKLLSQIDHFELASYRILFSLIPMIFIVKIGNIKASFQAAMKYPAQILLASACMFTNIFFFIYAVNTGHVLEASFGYFLNPLLSILLGVFLLKEKLSSVEKFALGLTCISVMIRFSSFDSIPWISFILAGAFSTYGLLKKYVHMDTLRLTFVEMTMLLIPSVWILVASKQLTIFTQATQSEQFIVLLAGIPTIAPFLLFNYGVKTIPLSIVGFFNYLAPTLQFLLGYFVYQEPIIPIQWLSFLFIWIACGIVATNNYLKGKRARK